MTFYHKKAVKNILYVEKFLLDNDFKILKDFHLWPLIRGELWWNISRDINVPELLKERNNLEVSPTDKSSRLIRSNNSKHRKIPSENALILTRGNEFSMEIIKWKMVRCQIR